MFEKELELAIAAATQAGDFLKQRQGINVDSLEGKDIKLSSDKMSEKIIMDALAPSGIPLLAEESGFHGENKGTYWIVDPLDGTINYFKGLDDLACVSVALFHDGQPVLGVVNRFMRGEVFSGAEGMGAFLNGQPVKPSGVEETKQAVMATGFPVKRDYSDDSLAVFMKQVQQFKKVRMLGAAALMGVFVCCGRVDAYFEEDIMLWDVAGAVAIVRAAGGEAELMMRDEFKCICRCFANRQLMEDFHAKSL